ncbi:MAG: DUF4493 domain-containing protein [Bacteroidales bacterium]|nr:DUF4493 domain-containing protein [Bacteroidales bacterium]
MKTKTAFFRAALLLIGALAISSCDKLGYGGKSASAREGVASSSSNKGIVRVSFVPKQASKVSARTLSDYPDTNSFLLTVTNSKGVKEYEGSFGAAPGKFELDPGSYTVRAVSCEFSSPLFDCPQYGDEQVVAVEAGKEISVRLDCRQINAGLRMKVDYNFRVTYPDAVLYAKSAEGRLMYTYTEGRIGYFKPGSITLQLERNGKQESLFTRALSEQEILTINLSAAGGPVDPAGGGISMEVDTTRIWIEESFCYGQDGGSGISDAFSIDEAKAHVGDKGVWVYGYIVGGDLTSSACSFEAPFTSRTNIAIAAKSTCTDKAACIAVQLQKGDIRDALNLVDNPSLLGRQVFLKGTIVESYFGLPGLQNLTDYSF